MGRIVWRGKGYRHVSVGKDKSYDYQDPQDAWDAISDSDEDNPYLISVDAGEWQYTAPSSTLAPGWLFNGKSDIAIVGVSPEQCRFRRLSRVTGEYGGGCVQVGLDSGTITQRILLEGLQIINEINGESGEGNPPEGALYIGEEDTPAATLTWDDITIRNCIIGGVHDGLQIFGFDAPDDSGPATPGLIKVQSNIIQSCHDAYTVKGAVRLHSSGNQIYVNSAGIDPYLDTIADWKHSGIHYNCSYGITAATDRGANHYSIHSGEQIRVVNGGNTGASKTNQDSVAGFLIYANTAVANAPYRIKLTNSLLDVFLNSAETPTLGAAGILIRNGIDIPSGLFEASNLSIYLHQASVDAAAPTSVYGMLLNTNHATGGAEAFISNSRIRVQNDKAASNAYSLGCTNSQDTIKHGGIITEESTSAGSGTITAVAALS